MVIFPEKGPRVSQSDGAGSKWYGMLVCFFTADDEDLLDISLVALTNQRFYGNCTHVKKIKLGKLESVTQHMLLALSHRPTMYSYLHGLPHLFPYFVYFAPIVFRGIVSMLIPAEI